MMEFEGTVYIAPRYECSGGEFVIPFHAEKVSTNVEDLKSISEFFEGKNHQIRYLHGNPLPILKGNRLKVEMHSIQQVRDYYQRYMVTDSPSLWPLSISVLDKETGEELFHYLDCRRLR